MTSIDEDWLVVANGDRYRVRNSHTGEFATKDTTVGYQWITIPVEFSNKEEAFAYAAKLTWKVVCK